MNAQITIVTLANIVYCGYEYDFLQGLTLIIKLCEVTSGQMTFELELNGADLTVSTELST